MTQQVVIWKGASRREYEYRVYNLDARWNDVPGNYIFAARLGSGWKAIYVGETESFVDRLPTHEKWPCVRRNGATHIHAHINRAGTAARRSEESDLIAEHRPPCNSD